MRSPSLIVVTQASGSGMGRFTVELVRGLESAGAKVTLVAPPQEGAVSCTGHIEVRSFKGVRSRWRRMLLYFLQPLGAAHAVLRTSGPGKPVLMIHVAAMLPFSLLPILAARMRGSRVALSLHDFYPHTLRFPRPLQSLERAIYRWVYRRFDLLFTNNVEQAIRLQKEANVPASRIAPMFHGVFPVHGVRMPDHADETRLLVFGSLRPNKRVMESIKAVLKLREAGLAVRLRIAGAPRREDPLYWQACRSAIPDGDPNFEVYDRFIDERELPELFSGVDAFLCPYLNFESQSGVSITAVSNGIPVIGTPAAKAAMAGIGNSAFVVVDPAADTEMIAEAIARFTSIPRSVRSAAAKHVQRRFLTEASWNELGKKYLREMGGRGLLD